MHTKPILQSLFLLLLLSLCGVASAADLSLSLQLSDEVSRRLEKRLEQ